MKEAIYAIPVNDAFDTECECPICAMKIKLEKDAVEYAMGPSYMEDDSRALTDEFGFCEKHMKAVRAMDNSLGLALVMNTHFDKVIRDIKKLSTGKIKPKSLFKKDNEPNPVVSYIKKLDNSCFVCNRINNTFDRYIDTIFYLWKTDANFKTKFKGCKGFCTTHYGVLLENIPDRLRGSDIDEFATDLNELYISNMERVRDDLAWFINKFDYKYADEPWKNAKDAIPRAMTKDNSIIEE